MACLASWGGVAPYPAQLTNLIPNRIDHPYVQPAIAVGCGCRRKKQRRRLPFFKIGSPFFFNIILDGRQALAGDLVAMPAAALFFHTDVSFFKTDLFVESQ